MRFLHLTAVEVIAPHQLRVWFDDGVVKDVDLAGELCGDVFAPLKDPDAFASAFLNPETGTVEWPNGADLAPEFLYERGVAVETVGG